MKVTIGRIFTLNKVGIEYFENDTTIEIVETYTHCLKLKWNHPKFNEVTSIISYSNLEQMVNEK